MSLSGRLWEIVNNTRTILINKEVEKGERKRVALAYLRMALWRKRNRYRFLGFDVKIFDHYSFLYLFREIFVDRCYQFKAKTDSPHIVDLGSNIGLSILFFKRLYPKSTIIGFEPDQETFDLLSENVSKNVNGVKLVKAAVGTYKGKIDFYSSEKKGWWGMSTLKKKETTTCKKVDVVPLSDYLNRKVDLLKVDIEGTGVEVICGAKDKLCNVDRIVMEYHFNQKNKIAPLFEVLEEAGFHCRMASAETKPPYLDLCFWGGIVVAERNSFKNEVFIEKEACRK